MTPPETTSRVWPKTVAGRRERRAYIASLHDGTRTMTEIAALAGCHVTMVRSVRHEWAARHEIKLPRAIAGRKPRGPE